MGWAVEAVADYVENVRPRFGCADHPALWVTERGGRVKPAEINARFVAYRDALGLPKALVPHSMRHAYVTHLTEDGVDRRFIQQQVGHERDSSTAIYTHVSDDFMNTALRKALAPAFAGAGRGRTAMARQAGLPLAPAQGHGRPRHVRHHRPDRAAGRTRDRLSSSQVYRLVVERPERLSLKILMALLDILDCTMEDLIEPVVRPGRRRTRTEKAAGAEAGVGDLRPKRARIRGADGRDRTGAAHRAVSRPGRAHHGPGRGGRTGWGRSGSAR